MKDNEIVEIINQRIQETNYPGSSLNNGVYPLVNKKSEPVAVFFPEGNCILVNENNKVIRKVYDFQQAEKIADDL